VQSVSPGSQAAATGLQAGDLVTALSGSTVVGPSQLMADLVALNVLLLVLLLSIALAVPELRGVVEAATEAGPGWLLLAALLELASCLGDVAAVRSVLPDGPACQRRACRSGAGQAHRGSSPNMLRTPGGHISGVGLC
jgi:hypothetical protein